MCPEKSIFFCEIAWKNLKFSEIFLENLNFFTRVHEPQISNQIDAAGLVDELQRTSWPEAG